MESYFLDWANLLLRWAHVVTAIAWVGSSFYFVFLDSSLTEPQDEDLKRQGVSGELWAVHGGGFYHPVKFAVAPFTLPAHLHWFYWESYSTWLTGMALFTVSYLWNASSYLIDKSLMDWSSGAAIGVALSFLAVFWMLYDLICQAFGQRKHGEAIVGALVLVLVCVASWLACHWFAGRAAFLLVGAMLATAMSANVFFWIIPGQRKVIEQIKANLPVDRVHWLPGLDLLDHLPLARNDPEEHVGAHGRGQHRADQQECGAPGEPMTGQPGGDAHQQQHQGADDGLAVFALAKGLADQVVQDPEHGQKG